MRRPALAVRAILLAGAVAVAGCSGDSDSAGGGGGTATTIGGEGATTSLPVTVSGAVDLRRLVVADAPAGYGLLPSPPFGAVDLQRLLTDFSDAPMQDRVILEGARFKGGYTRGWRKEAEPRAFLGVFVFEFDDDAGAGSARDQFAAQDDRKTNISPFAVDGIAGATGESYTRGAEGQPTERVHTVTFVRGPRLYQVDGVFAGEQDHIDEIVAFAKIEDRLAA